MPALKIGLTNKLVRRFASTLPKSSYVHGASNIPLKNETIGELLLKKTELHPDKELFVFPQQQIRKSYEQLYNDAYQLATGLLSIGFEKGDRLGIWAPNVYEWTQAQFAAAMAGLILVNINPAYKATELEYCLAKVGVKGVIAPTAFKTQDYYDMFAQILPKLDGGKPGQINDKRLPSLRHIIFTGGKRRSGAWLLDDIVAAGDSASAAKLENITSRISSDDAVNIQFTSGTTGSPKGAALSDHNIVNNAFNLGLRQEFHLKDNEKICCVPPLYHCVGCVAGSLCAVVHGATAIFPSTSFDPKAALEAIANERCTALYGTPTMFIDIMNHPNFNEFDVSSLRTGIIAGAPCPIEVCKQMISKLHMHDFTICYGTTENSPVTFQTRTSDTPEIRTSTVGSVQDHVEAKIVDAEGVAVPRGTSGELWIRGYVVMKGYWDDLEKTAEVISDDRWYHTGDLAIMDENGYVAIIGRLKDMVIRGGENIYPTEIEQFLHKHPKIVDVQVIGVPDDRLGEELCAWIRLADGESATAEEIRAYCKDKIAHFKIPKYIQFKKQEDFPVTITGKIQKFKMREIATRELAALNSVDRQKQDAVKI